MQRRREQRIPVEILSRFRTGSGCAHNAYVANLSRTGCLLVQNFSTLPVGKRITIRLDTIGPIDSVVRWHEGRRVGVEFVVPLHHSVLEHLAERFQFGDAGLSSRRPVPMHLAPQRHYRSR